MKYLTKHHYAVKYVGNRVGTPDILCCINGSFVGFEVKRSEKHKTTKIQDYNHEKLRKNGGYVFVVWNLDQVKHLIEKVIK